MQLRLLYVKEVLSIFSYNRYIRIDKTSWTNSTLLNPDELAWPAIGTSLYGYGASLSSIKNKVKYHLIQFLHDSQGQK